MEIYCCSGEAAEGEDSSKSCCLSGYQVNSDIHEDGWLVRELLLLNAHDWAVHRVVDVWQVSLSWSLSDSSELIVDRSVTKANPSLVSSEIWHWNATQMSANGRAHKNAGVSSIRKGDNGFFIKKSSGWEGVGRLDLIDGKSSDENDFSIPGSLEDFTRWEFRDIKLLI